MRDRFQHRVYACDVFLLYCMSMQSSLKWIGGIIVLLILVIGGGYLAGKQQSTNESGDNAAVIGTAIGFGQSMQKVSLQAPQADFEVALDQAYGRFVAPALITAWKAAPASAPGRKTSSPWPQNIEILSTTKQTDGTYVVKGNVLEVTSHEVSSGGYADKYPITLILQKIKGTWMIIDYHEDPSSTS